MPDAHKKGETIASPFFGQILKFNLDRL